MSKKTKPTSLKVGPDKYKIIIADDGAIESDTGQTIYATAAEVRAIAAESERLHGQTPPPEAIRRTESGYDVYYRNSTHGNRNGAVQIGCQEIPYKVVQQLAALSAARVARKVPTTTRRPAARRRR